MIPLKYDKFEAGVRMALFGVLLVVLIAEPFWIGSTTDAKSYFLGAILTLAVCTIFAGVVVRDLGYAIRRTDKSARKVYAISYIDERNGAIRTVFATQYDTTPIKDVD